MKQVIEQLKIKRKKSKLSQKEVAEMIGVTLMAVSHWENHQRFPHIDSLYKWAKALGCELEVRLI